MMEAASEINKRSSAALSVFSKMGMRRRMKARQADARAKGVPAREYTQYLGPWSLTRTSHRRLAKLQVSLLRITRRLGRLRFCEDETASLHALDKKCTEGAYNLYSRGTFESRYDTRLVLRTTSESFSGQLTSYSIIICCLAIPVFS